MNSPAWRVALVLSVVFAVVGVLGVGVPGRVVGATVDFWVGARCPMQPASPVSTEEAVAGLEAVGYTISKPRRHELCGSGTVAVLQDASRGIDLECYVRERPSPPLGVVLQFEDTRGGNIHVAGGNLECFVLTRGDLRPAEAERLRKALAGMLGVDP